MLDRKLFTIKSMNLNPLELQEEFLAKHPHLISLSKKYYRARRIGMWTIIVSLLLHFLNFIFFESFAIGLIMVIVPVIIFAILYWTGEPNFYQKFDNLKNEYMQNLLEGMKDSSLEFVDSEVEMDESEVEEVGFLKQNIHSAFRPIRRNYIKGTYKGVQIKIGELDFKHQKYKRVLIDRYWQPSTLVVFNYGEDCDETRVSLFVKKSRAYRGLSNMNPATIHLLKKMIKLDGMEIKTNIKHLDSKYLTLTTKEENSRKILSEKVKDSLISFNKWHSKEKGVSSIYNAKFLTLYKGNIAILIFRQKFLEVRMDSIFEVYHQELKSILQFVDMFASIKKKS